MAVNGNGHLPKAAERMATTCAERERRDPLYFNAAGKLLPFGGWKYGHGEGTRSDGSSYVGGTAKGAPGGAVYIVDYPFRPSVLSLADMIAEHQVTGEVVIYCEERWEVDPRIEEQAGPSLIEDWMLIELVQKRMVSA